MEYFVRKYVAKQNGINIDQVTDNMEINDQDHFFTCACQELSKPIFTHDLPQRLTIKAAIKILEDNKKS